MNYAPELKKDSYAENEFVEFWIEEGIIIEVIKPHITEVNLEMARAIVALRLKVSNGVTRPLLIDSNNTKGLTSEARKYFYTEESVMYISACGFLVHGYVAWLAGKIFATLIPQKVRTNIFRTKKPAMAWLQHFKNLN